MKRIPFIAGNWKMNMNCEKASNFANEIKKLEIKDGVQLAIAAPFTQLQILKQALKDSKISVFAQNMHFEDKGAYTGEVSAPMLKELEIDGVILGHSERRSYFGETDDSVLKKVWQALEYDLKPIVCVGESKKEREEGSHLDFVEKQLKSIFCGLTKEQAASVVVAYEPIWAIGTGLTATPLQAQEMCSFIRKKIADLHGEDCAQSVIIQYGGSVKASNCEEIFKMPDIDGGLIGGASLKPEELAEIANKGVQLDEEL